MIILLGAPGSGKGTQSRLLAIRAGFEIISVGEILRNEISNRSMIGLDVEQRLKAGEFADTGVVVKLVESRLESEKRIVLDGFPRNLEQAEAFDEIFQKLQCKYASTDSRFGRLLVLDFVLPVDVLKSRLISRKICKNCAAAFLKDELKCMFCGSKEFIVRDDDVDEIIEKRIEKFLKEHNELVEFYSQKEVYRPISSDFSVEDVYSEIMSYV